MIIRLRTKVGMWRHEAEPSTKLSELLAKVEHEKACRILKVSKRPNYAEPLQDQGSKTLGELGLKHGDMLYVEASGASSAGASKDLVGGGPKAIDSHGNVVATDATTKTGFRPGLQSLRTQKLHWTLTDMVEFDNKYTFEIKGEQNQFCSSASLDAESCNNFQSYLQNFALQTCRCGYLYGNFVKAEEIVGSVEYNKAQESGSSSAREEKEGGTKKYGQTKGTMKLADLDLTKDEGPKFGVRVDFIYEPLQTNSAESFELLEDPREEKVDALAKALGLEKVGFIFSHPPREGYNFSTEEIIHAGEQALESTDGKFDSPFVIVKVTSDQGNATFDAFSLTPQCLEMIAEDALLAMKDNPGVSAANSTFTIIVEKKETHVIDNDMFIKRVPILSHTSPFTGSFPRLNRDTNVSMPPSTNAIQKVLRDVRNASDGEVAKAISDFHVLLYLSEVFDEESLVAIGKFVASHVKKSKKPLRLEEGYKVIMFSFAGLD